MTPSQIVKMLKMEYLFSQIEKMSFFIDSFILFLIKCKVFKIKFKQLRIYGKILLLINLIFYICLRLENPILTEDDLKSLFHNFWL